MARAFSLEDKNLSTSTITTSRNRLYRDIDLSLAIKGNKDVYKKLDAAAVKQSVKNLVLTNHGEKPFRYNYELPRALRRAGAPYSHTGNPVYAPSKRHHRPLDRLRFPSDRSPDPNRK